MCQKNEQQEESKLHIAVLTQGIRRYHQMKLVVGNTEWIQQLYFQQGKNRL